MHRLSPILLLLLLHHLPFLHADTSLNTHGQIPPPHTSTNHRNTLIEEYYNQPILKWTKQLGNGIGTIYDDTTLRRGNGIVVSPDDNTLYITTNDGLLHIIHAHHPNAGQRRVYDPSLVVLQKRGWYTFCQSSVSLHFERRSSNNNNGGVLFAVYAVVDVPSSFLERERSRVIAVTHLGQKLWSTVLPGVIVGTPLLSPDGRYVYLTHNTNNETLGYFTALDADAKGSIVFTEHNQNDAPYGPLALISSNEKDNLYFGELPGRDYSDHGILHTITRRSSGVSDGIFESAVLHQTRWSTGTAPTVSRNGRKLWMSGKNAWIRGVTGDTSLSDQMMWKTDLEASLRNRTTPVYNRAVISSDERYLYVASTSTSFYCLEANTGRIVWKNAVNSASIFLTEAKLSYDDSKLYTIKHNEGTVTQQDAKTGHILWQTNCSFVFPNPLCQDSVEAEFALSSDGSTLYYGDIFGKLVALTVGRTPPPTSSPTLSPTVSPKPTGPPPTPSPTASPSNQPTASPTDLPTTSPTTSPTGSPTALPTTSPTDGPSEYPTVSPSDIPTGSPTNTPTTLPSLPPTPSPSQKPSTSTLPSSTPTTTTLPSSTPTHSNTPTIPPTITPEPSSKPTVTPSPTTPFFKTEKTTEVKPETTTTSGFFSLQSVSGQALVITVVVFCTGLTVLLCALLMRKMYRQKSFFWK